MAIIFPINFLRLDCLNGPLRGNLDLIGNFRILGASSGYQVSPCPLHHEGIDYDFNFKSGQNDGCVFLTDKESIRIVGINRPTNITSAFGTEDWGVGLITFNIEEAFFMHVSLYFKNSDFADVSELDTWLNNVGAPQRTIDYFTHSIWTNNGEGNDFSWSNPDNKELVEGFEPDPPIFNSANISIFEVNSEEERINISADIDIGNGLLRINRDEETVSIDRGYFELNGYASIFQEDSDIETQWKALLDLNYIIRSPSDVSGLDRAGIRCSLRYDSPYNVTSSNLKSFECNFEHASEAIIQEASSFWANVRVNGGGIVKKLNIFDARGHITNNSEIRELIAYNFAMHIEDADVNSFTGYKVQEDTTSIPGVKVGLQIQALTGGEHGNWGFITQTDCRFFENIKLYFGDNSFIYSPEMNKLKIESSVIMAAGDYETVQDKAYYIGDKDTDGTWRIIRNDNDLMIERREGGSYEIKNIINA